MRYDRESEGIFLIRETGDIIKYVGEALTDPHKGEYDSEYVVLIPGRFKKGDRVCYYEFYERRANKETIYYNLTKLPTDINLDNINPTTLKVLYGQKN